MPAPHETHSCVGQECCSQLIVPHFALDRCLANQDKGVAANVGPQQTGSLPLYHTVVDLCLWSLRSGLLPSCHCTLYCTSTSSCPRTINCSPEHVRRRVVVSCRGLLGQRRLLVHSEKSETAAPVSSSITKGWSSICNGTSKF